MTTQETTQLKYLKYSLIQRYWKIFPLIALILGILIIVISLLFNPIFFERYISSDQHIERITAIAIFIFDVVAFFIGFLSILIYKYIRVYTKRKEEIVKNGILFISSIAFTLIMSEIGLQVANHYLHFCRERHYFFQYDEILGWKHKSNRISNFKNTEVRINSKSLRDDEIPYKKPVSEFRIICLGDSQTFGDGVNEQETFVSLIEDNFKNVQVINTAVIGYGTDQQLLFFKREGVKYSPDLVMVFFNAHDITDNICKTIKSGYYKPRFELKENKLILTNVPVKKFDLVERVNRYISDWSFIYYFSHKGLKTIIDKIILNFNPRSKTGKDERFEEYAVLPHPSKMKYAVEITKKILKEIVEESKKIGAKPIVVFLPFKSDFDLTLNQASQIYKELIKFGQENNIIVLDIRFVLAKYIQRTNIYLDGIHFNIEGNKIIADILTKELIKLGMGKE